MLIPDKVVIFGRSYEIQDVPRVHAADGILGRTSFRDGKIYLDDDTDLSLGLSTLWSETAQIAQQEILGSMDRAQARWIALFVHNFLVNNPKVAACYCRGSETVSERDGQA